MKKSLTLLIVMMISVAALFAQAPEKFSYQAVVRNANNTLVTNQNVSVRISILQGGVNGAPVYVETHTATTNMNGLLTIEVGGGTMVSGSLETVNWAEGPFFLKSEIDPDGGINYSIEGTQQLLSVPYALYAKEAANSFSGDYNDLTNKPQIPTVPTNVSAFTNDAGYITNNDIPAIPTVPTNVSAFTNDAGYITGYTETDPLFTAWDKDYNDLTNKPTIPTVPTNVSTFSNDAGYITMDSIPDIPTVPSNVSAFVNDAGYLTSYTEQQVLSISNDTIFLTGGSSVKLPAGFDGDYNSLTNKPVIPTVPTSLSAFVNDMGYITAIPDSLGSISVESDPIFSAWDKDYNDLINTPEIPTVPTNVSEFTNDAGYLTGYTETDPQFTAWDKNYNDLTNKPNLFSGDYNDLTNKPTIPTVPDSVSAFVNDAGYLTSYTEQQVLSISNDTIFLTGGSFVKLPAAAVGFSGDYNDLINKPQIPTIPDNVSTFTNDAGYLTSYTETDPQFTAWDKNYNDLTNKPNLFSGDYNDLTNKPTIPTVPDSVSAFVNDAGYITTADIPAQPQGTAVGDLLYWNGSAWVVVPAGQQGQQLVMDNGVPTWQNVPDNSLHYIRFEANGGTGSMNAQFFPNNVAQTVSNNTFVRSGYMFIGWNTAADGTGTSYAPDAVLTLTQNIILYAQWTTRVRVNLPEPCGQSNIQGE